MWNSYISAAKQALVFTYLQKNIIWKIGIVESFELQLTKELEVSI
jgi:hypothetical protein